MKKKVLSLLLAVTMITGLLAGCGDDASDTGGENSQQPEGGNENAENQNGETELTTITVLAVDRMADGTYTTEGGWKDTLAGQKLIEDLAEIGIELEVEFINWDNNNYFTTVNARMSAGTNLPDIIFGQYQEAAFNAWGEAGLLIPASELMEEYDEDGSINAYFEENAGIAYEAQWVGDNLYFFPDIENICTAVDDDGEEIPWSDSTYGFVINKNWMEAIGEEVKQVYTPDELYEIVLKMQEQDVNGNGSRDEVININLTSFYNGLSTAFGLSNGNSGHYNNNGTAEQVWNFEHENFPAYIEFIRKCLENGVMTEDSISDRNAVDTEGRTAIKFSQFAADTSSMGDDDYAWILCDYDGDYTNGICVQIERIEPSCHMSYGVTSACENPEAVMRMMDYIYSDEYAMLYRYGVEGSGYTVDSDGVVTSLYDVNNDDTWGLNNVGLQYSIPSVVVTKERVTRVNEDMPEEGGRRDRYAAGYDFFHEIYPYTKTYVEIFPSATEEEQEIIDMYQNALDTYQSEALMALILGERSVDEIPDMIEEMEGMGIREVLEVEYNRATRAYN